MRSEQSMRGSKSLFDVIDGLHCKYRKVSLKRGFPT